MPYEKSDLVRNPASDLAQEFSCELFELKRRAFEYLFVERVDVVDAGRCVGHDCLGDRGLRPFRRAELSPHFPARARAEGVCEIVFEILVVDIERSHWHAGHASEAGVVQAE